MPIHAVLFDLDNTLFDHQGSARKGLDSFLRLVGTAPSEDLERSWFDIERQTYDRFLANGLSFQEQRRERLRQFLPLAGIDIPAAGAKLDELFGAYLQDYKQAWTAFPDALPALQRLRAAGVPVGVITNGNHEQQTSKIKRIGLGPLLHHVFSSEQTGYAKPAAGAFLDPCKSMGLPAAETLYVGDNYVTDVAGARQAGLQAIHLDRDGDGANGSIQSLADLFQLTGHQVPA